MITFIDWIPALSSTSALGIVIYLSRNLIITRLKNAVKHEYDSKLELLKSDLSNKEKEIDSLRNLGLGSFQQRQSLLFERQLSAIELLWNSTCKLNIGRSLSEMMLRVNADAVSESIGHDKKLQDFFKIISTHCDTEKMASVDPAPARPFVSKLAWAYYSAYSAIIWHYVLQAKLFEHGLGIRFLDEEKITKLVGSALPHQSQFIEKFGVSAFGHLLDELQNKILIEIDSTLNGISIDQNRLQKAAEIQKIAQELSDINQDLKAHSK